MDLVDAALVPIIIGLVEVAKRLGLPSAYAGILAVVLGLVLVAVQSYLGGRSGEVILTGLATGLAAAGLYSATKAALGG